MECLQLKLKFDDFQASHTLTFHVSDWLMVVQL